MLRTEASPFGAIPPQNGGDCSDRRRLSCASTFQDDEFSFYTVMVSGAKRSRNIRARYAPHKKYYSCRIKLRGFTELVEPRLLVVCCVFL